MSAPHIELVDAVEAYCTRCGWHEVYDAHEAWTLDFETIHPYHPADPSPEKGVPS